MTPYRPQLFLVALLLLGACGRDPAQQKQRLLKLGDDYLAKGQYQEASLLYRKAIQLDGRLTEAYDRLGASRWKLHDYDGVAWALRRAWELGSENPEVFRKLAEVHFMALASPEQPQKCEVLDSLIKLQEAAEVRHSQGAEVASVKGRILLRLGYLEEAIQVLTEAHRRAPSDEAAMNGLVSALYRSDRTDEAEAVARKYLDGNPTATGTYSFLSRLYIKQRRLEQAEAILRRRCDNVNDGEAWVSLGQFYRGLGRDEEAEPAIEHLFDNPESFPEAHRLAGDFYLAGGKVGRALDHYREGAESSPESERMYRERIVRAHLARGDTAAAKRELDVLLAKNQADPMAVQLLVHIARVSRDRELKSEVLEALKTGLAKLPRSHLFRYYYGEALNAAGRETDALTQFREALRLKPEFLPPKRALMDYHLNRNEYTKVRVLAEEILEDFPDDATAHLALSAAYAGLRQFEEARQELAWLLRTRRLQRDAVHQLARVELAEKNYERAEGLFNFLSKANPPDPRGVRGLLDIRVAQGRLGEAQSMLDLETEKQSENFGLQLAAARFALSRGENERAEAYVSRVIEKLPQNPAARLYLAMVLEDRGEREQAKEHLRIAMKAEPPLSDVFLQYGTVLILGQNYGGSISYLEESIAINPENSLALNNLAYALAETGRDLDEAMAYARRAVAIRPDSPAYVDTLGYVYIKRQLFASAIEVLEKLVREHPMEGPFRYHLGVAYRGAGDLERARVELRAARQLELPDEFAKPLERMLAEIDD